MGFTMGLNMLLLIAMVATNILSLYHLTTNINSTSTPSPLPAVPDHLLRQLQTIRATINHLTRLQQPSPQKTSMSSPPNIPSDLLMYAHMAPIASACRDYPDLLHQFMNYTPFALCPSDSAIAEALMLRGCHPLLRRRCFSITTTATSIYLQTTPFPKFPDNAVIWKDFKCKSFDCLAKSNPELGFDMKVEQSRFISPKSDLDLPIQQLLQIARSAKSVIRLGIDIGGGTGTFAAQMKLLQNATILTTTMNLGAPYNEAVALRGLVPLHVPLQQRLPVFDGVVDIVRCGHAVNRWIPVTMMEFLFFDVDRVLRGGGYFWLDHFFSKKVDLEKVYQPMIWKLGYKKVKWAVANKTDSSGVKNQEVYLTALLQKPVSR